MSLLWKRKRCGCVKTKLLVDERRVFIRCAAHRGKPAKKGALLAHFDDAGIVRLDLHG